MSVDLVGVVYFSGVNPKHVALTTRKVPILDQSVSDLAPDLIPYSKYQHGKLKGMIYLALLEESQLKLISQEAKKNLEEAILEIKEKKKAQYVGLAGVLPGQILLNRDYPWRPKMPYEAKMTALGATKALEYIKRDLSLDWSRVSIVQIGAGLIGKLIKKQLPGDFSETYQTLELPQRGLFSEVLVEDGRDTLIILDVSAPGVLQNYLMSGLNKHTGPYKQVIVLKVTYDLGFNYKMCEGLVDRIFTIAANGTIDRSFSLPYDGGIIPTCMMIPKVKPDFLIRSYF